MMSRRLEGVSPLGSPPPWPRAGPCNATCARRVRRARPSCSRRRAACRPPTRRGKPCRRRSGTSQARGAPWTQSHLRTYIRAVTTHNIACGAQNVSVRASEWGARAHTRRAKRDASIAPVPRDQADQDHGRDWRGREARRCGGDILTWPIVQCVQCGMGWDVRIRGVRG